MECAAVFFKLNLLSFALNVYFLTLIHKIIGLFWYFLYLFYAKIEDV